MKKKDVYKLAQLVKYAAKDVSKETSYWKMESVSGILGCTRTDRHPEELYVKDDDGYRSIVVGDYRGNVSLDTGKMDNNIFHKGYAYLYSESCDYDGDKRKWQYRCFPPTRTIANMLYKLSLGEYCPELIDYYPGDNDDIKACVDYLSEVINHYLDIIASDNRTAWEIFKACMDA